MKRWGWAALAAATVSNQPTSAAVRSPSAALDSALLFPFQPNMTYQTALPKYSEELRNKCNSLRLEFDCKASRALANLPAFPSVAPDCDNIVPKYSKVLGDCGVAGDREGCGVPDAEAVSAGFDAACLSSALPWRHPDGVTRRDKEPEIFTRGGTRQGVSGALNAVVLIEIGDTHHCSGLLLPQNVVMTARHCFHTQEQIDAVRTGGARARIVGRPGEVFDLEEQAEAPLIARPEPPSVGDDLVRLRLAGPPVPAPRVIFGVATRPEAVTVVSHFLGWDRARSSTPPTEPRWRLGLRWPRDNMCHAVTSSERCVRILCETVPGFSGAPIFALGTRPDEPLRVLGLVSRRDTKAVASDCGRPLPGATVATLINEVKN